MDFESLKEQILENLTTYLDKIKDSEVYIKLKERYDNLPSNYQQAIVYGTVVLVVYFIYSIPASFVTSANEKLEYFEENRQLTRELIRAGRIARTVKLPPIAPTTTSLQSQMEGQLAKEQIMPEQNKGITPAEGVASKTLVPKSIIQNGVKANINNINLKQLVKLAESFDNINGSKLINMVLQADTKDPHYYNVEYEVASFSLPRPKIEATGKGNKKSRFKSKKRRGNK